MQVLTISILGIIVIIGTTVFEKYLRRPTVLRKQNLFQRSLIGTMTLVFAVAMMFGTTILAEDATATLTSKGGTLSFNSGAVQVIAHENTKAALSKAVLPAVGVATAYYLLMCSVFGMDKGLCIVGAVSFGIAVFVGLLLYRR